MRLLISNQNRFTTIFKFLFIVLVATILFACDSHLNIIKRDAGRFCAIHNKNNWSNLESFNTADELEVELNKRITSEVKTDEFKAVVRKLNTVEFYRDLYPTAQSEINALTKETWDCPAYQDFYLVSFKRETTNEYPSNVHDDGDASVTISLGAGGMIHVDSVELVDTSSDALKKRIREEISDSKPLIVIHTNLDTNQQDINRILSVMSELGITRVQLVSPEEQ